MSRGVRVARETVHRLRELIQVHGVAGTARIAKCPKQTISDLKTGKTYRTLDAITIEELGLRRGSGKRCRRCNEIPILVAKSHLCIACELLDLAKLGTITIKEAGDVEEDS